MVGEEVGREEGRKKERKGKGRKELASFCYDQEVRNVWKGKETEL
jgi:hypothetical protein